jgi:NACHT/LRR/PYD domain-containing protein 3
MDQCYINLTIVKGHQATEDITEDSEAINQSSPFSRTARLMVERPAENLEIPLQDMFDPRKLLNNETRVPKRIFIRGRAGVGKSTLCKKIVYEFINRGMWQHEFCRVLLIPLRNLKLKERCQVAGYNLGHLLSHEFFTELPESKVLVDALWRNLTETCSENTLFILDGLDEVSSDLEGDMERFLDGLLNRPNIIVTSRPHADISPRVNAIDLELETIGFYPEQVMEYVSKSFTDMPKIATSIGSFLQDHQLMRDLVRIPVQLDALCYIWKDLDSHAISQTMTSIYQAIEENLWKKDSAKLGRFRSSQVVRLKTLEHRMADEINFLEAMAFTGMYTDTVEFTQDHQDKVLDRVLETTLPLFDDGLSQLSFLRTSNPSSRIEDRRYHFLHLTYQEYFAARYFVRQWNCEARLSCCRWSKRSEKISPCDFIQEYKYDLRYDIMWRFVAGLLDIEDGLEVTRFFQAIEKEPRDLLGPAHQRLVMHCLSEVVRTAESPFSAFRMRLENDLSRWVMAECEYKSRSLLAEESELSDMVLESVFHEGTDRTKKIVLDATGERSTLPSCMIDFALSRLSYDYGAVHDGRNTAIRVLKKLSNVSEEALQSVATRLEHQCSDVRQAAVDILGARLDLSGEMIQSVAARLEHNNPDVRQAAIKVLGQQFDLSKEMLWSIVARLGDQDQDVRQTAIEFLMKQSDPSEEMLLSVLAHLRDKDRCVRRAVIYLLGKRSSLSEDMLLAVAARFEDRDPHVRQAAIELLKKYPNLPGETLRSVAARLEHQDWYARIAAIEVIGVQSDLSEELLWSVAARLEDPDRSVRRTAIELLGKRPTLPEDMLKLVTSWLEHRDGRIRHTAIELLGKFSDLSEEMLGSVEARLADSHRDVRQAAIEVLGKQSDLSSEMLQSVVARLEDEDQLVRQAAIDRLRKHTNLSEEMLRSITAQLEHQDTDVQQAAIDVLVCQDLIPHSIVARYKGPLYDGLLWRSFAHHMTWTCLEQGSFIRIDTKRLRLEVRQKEVRDMIREKQNSILHPHQQEGNSNHSRPELRTPRPLKAARLTGPQLDWAH